MTENGWAFREKSFAVSFCLECADGGLYLPAVKWHLFK
jgi:hypothetical protein